MAKHRAGQAQESREEFRNVIRFSVADEIKKLGRSGSISDDKFARLRPNLRKAA
jgi:hypothetical protein